MEPTSGHAGSSRRAAIDAPSGPFDDYLNIPILKKLAEFVTERKAASTEEDDLRRVDSNDTIIFRNIDRLFLDDTLLAKMLEILLLRPQPLNDMLRFVVAVVQSRLELCIPEALSEGFSKISWPWTLTRGVRSSLADALAESMCSQLLHSSSIDWWELSRRDSQWSASFAFVVLLTNPNEILSAGSRLIHASTQYAIERDFYWNPLDVFSYQMRTLVQYDDSWPVRSLVLLAQSLEQLKAEDAARCLANVVHASFIVPTGMPYGRSYRALLEVASIADDDTDMQPTPQMMVVLLEAARVILHKYTLEQTESQDTFPPDFEDLLEFVLDTIPIVKGRQSDFVLRNPLTPMSHSDEPSLARVLTDLFTTPQTIHSLFDFFVLFPHAFVVQKVLSLNTRVDDEVRAGWHRMFAAAVTCIGNAESASQESQELRSQEEHTEICNVAFTLIRDIHYYNNDDYDTGNPRRQHDIGDLSDRSKTSSPLLGSVDRALEGEVKEQRYAPARAYQAVEDAPDILDPTPIRSMTTEQEVTANSSRTASTLPVQLLVRGADQGSPSEASHVGYSSKDVAVVSTQPAEREDTSVGAVESEIRVVLRPASPIPLRTADDSGE
ncbi:hypothetical protein EIP86_006584 [Pleurotus ostreatoroseus]|nr:hypothetical protein EIP86_006584 [Pleurotus ostreatoroseus]